MKRLTTISRLRKTAGMRGENRECPKIRASLGFSLLYFYLYRLVAYLAGSLRFSGKLGHGTVGNCVTTTRIMKRAREDEKKNGA